MYIGSDRARRFVHSLCRTTHPIHVGDPETTTFPRRRDCRRAYQRSFWRQSLVCSEFPPYFLLKEYKYCAIDVSVDQFQ